MSNPTNNMLQNASNSLQNAGNTISGLFNNMKSQLSQAGVQAKLQNFYNQLKNSNPQCNIPALPANFQLSIPYLSNLVQQCNPQNKNQLINELNIMSTKEPFTDNNGWVSGLRIILIIILVIAIIYLIYIWISQNNKKSKVSTPEGIEMKEIKPSKVSLPHDIEDTENVELETMGGKSRLNIPLASDLELPSNSAIFGEY